ncbi:MAG: carboxypeptidase regulatory-like domain-containing protein [Gammaproteobacteria bacterium]|nr:carboxypeptidase regulatory-like domain-containing protein [Gammaproteobacteria bacterium]
MPAPTESSRPQRQCSFPHAPGHRTLHARCRAFLGCAAAGVALLLASATGSAAVLSGVVTNAAGQPLEGTIITAVDKEQQVKFSVYTDAQGRYTMNYDASNPFRLRARHFTFLDQFKQVDDFAATAQLDFTMETASNDDIRRQLPAHVWVERIGRIDPDMDREFRIECMMCHQQGNNMARWPTTREQWHTVFDRMAHKNAMVSQDTREKTIDALLAAYAIENDEDVPRIPPMPRGRETNIEMTEWMMAPGTYMHDISVGPDGLIYGASAQDNQIWRLNPATNEREALEHVKPDGNALVGDALGLHTVFPDPNGKSMWFTYAQGNIVSRYDIETNTMKLWNMSYLRGIYPHTIRFDQQGQIWFTVTLTNQLGTINPETDELELINLPTRSWLQRVFAWAPIAAVVAETQRRTSFSMVFERELRPIAYGIDVTPDNRIWFSQYNNRRIGYYDKAADEITMVDTPFGGPRRFRTDSRGNLWIPAFTDGRIYKYEPDTETFTGYDLPTGSSDSVYAVAVDPWDDTIWGCGSNSDTMLHFDPVSETFTTYRFPSLVTFCREISFDEQGNIWTSYSNSPTVSIEDGVTHIVRISRPGGPVTGEMRMAQRPRGDDASL